ncbi:hypothetical protein DBZ36_05720 [Alginatibacterium sediminis]|uniref:PEP-CTERM sorting domain-containing protein n=1 Tax=Alginatibacterium sediminis TaxID=2164068 RepID=A0A420EH09_9ALTE|nr:hypothetical protein [Alginatibacterium sediminis]RKF19950.1 hypothetical protein DBZ36_05720 [Alginatibacterium sediminis]
MIGKASQLIFAATLFGMTSVANASAIYISDSGWQLFDWAGGVGASTSIGGFNLELSDEASLTVVDAFAFGDEFEIWINGIFNSLTSDVITHRDIYAFSGAEEAIALGFSHRTVSLDPGSYHLDFKLFQDGQYANGDYYLDGSGYFRVDSFPVSVSEPPMFGLFFLLVAYVLIRKYSKDEQSNYGYQP